MRLTNLKDARDENNKIVARMVAKGVGITEVCRATGVGYHAVVAACTEEGVELPPRQGLDEKTFAILGALMDPGKRMADVVAECRCSFTRVQTILDLARKANSPGLPRRGRGGRRNGVTERGGR